jgi:hypothetical protein
MRNILMFVLPLLAALILAIGPATAATVLVAERFATDSTHTSGFSGLFAYSQNPLPPVDVTWDNFSTASVSDDFSDLNDTANPTWTRLDGLVASMGQTWDASTGQYRMTAPNNGFSNLGFVGSYTGPSSTDVTVSADIVSFVDDPVAQGAPFGVGARLDGNNGFNLLKGYAYAYEPHAAGGLGEVVLYRINGASLVDLGAQQVTLDPNKDYRFVLNVTGSQLHGQVFEIVIPEPSSCLLVALGAALLSLRRRRG